MKKLKNTPTLLPLKFYKHCISPLLPHVCRFEPTCSNYAIECFQKHSFGHAALLSVKRICRCHPFQVGGFDPVPEP